MPSSGSRSALSVLSFLTHRFDPPQRPVLSERSFARSRKRHPVASLITVRRNGADNYKTCAKRQRYHSRGQCILKFMVIALNVVELPFHGQERWDSTAHRGLESAIEVTIETMMWLGSMNAVSLRLIAVGHLE